MQINRKWYTKSYANVTCEIDIFPIEANETFQLILKINKLQEL